MKNKKIRLFFFCTILISCLFSSFKDKLKDNNDFMNKINLKSKKYKGFSEQTVYNIWNNSSEKSKAFDHLKKLSAINYNQIDFDCQECKKNNMVLIDEKKYYYSNLIYTDSKSINKNELIDIYVLFDLICAIKNRNEISISESSLKSVRTPSTKSIVVDARLLPEDWEIPNISLASSSYSNPVELSGLELINKTINIVSLNRIIPTKNKWVKTAPSLVFLGGSLYSLTRANNWANYYTALENSGETDILIDQQNARSNRDAAINMAIVLGAVSIYHFYDWIANIYE